jgi:hypothetical protein
MQSFMYTRQALNHLSLANSPILTLIHYLWCTQYTFYWNCSFVDLSDAFIFFFFFTFRLFLDRVLCFMSGLDSGWKYLNYAFLVPGKTIVFLHTPVLLESGSNYLMSRLALNQNPHNVCLLSSCKGMSHHTWPYYYVFVVVFILWVQAPLSMVTFWDIMNLEGF